MSASLLYEKFARAAVCGYAVMSSDVLLLAEPCVAGNFAGLNLSTPISFSRPQLASPVVESAPRTGVSEASWRCPREPSPLSQSDCNSQSPPSSTHPIPIPASARLGRNVCISLAPDRPPPAHDRVQAAHLARHVPRTALPSAPRTLTRLRRSPVGSPDGMFEAGTVQSRARCPPPPLPRLMLCLPQARSPSQISSPGKLSSWAPRTRRSRAACSRPS